MGPLVMTLLVRDDVDVVDACIAYHLHRGVDLVIATEHRSQDGTADVLGAWERRGRLRLLRERGEPFQQDVWVTRMARLAAVEHRAAWVIHTDADEFWWPARGDLRTTLAAVPATVGSLLVPRANFMPSRHEDGPFFERMVMRDVASVNAIGAPLPPKVCHRGCADVVVGMGNHEVTSPSLGPPAAATTLEILHFPVRGWRQIERKVHQGARALASNAGLPEQVGITWRRLYDGAADGRLRAFWEEQVALGERGPAQRIVRDERLRRYLRAMSVVLPAGES
jgi:hypothetical protein